MSTKDNDKVKFNQTDPDLNEGDAEELENFDEPFRSKAGRKVGPAGRVSTDIENGLGNFFKGLNEVANFITDLAEKTEQAAQRASERRQADNSSEGPYRNGTNERGFGAKWGLNTNARPGTTPFTNRGTTNARPEARLSAAPAASELDASLREPHIEIHEEADDGLIVVIAEMPGVEEKDLQLEIQDDVLILRGDGPNFRYEKETLLPAIVQSEPESRSYQNGLLELRLRIK